MIAYIIIGFLSGIITAMGIGGGSILIPCLAYFNKDLSQQALQNINLIYFLPTSFLAIYMHKKNKLIEKDLIKPIVLSGLLAALLAALVANKISSDLLRKAFAVFLLLMGINEIRKKD